MGYPIKQGNTTIPLYFLMIDSTDPNHIAGKTGLAPTVKIKKVGVAAAVPAGAVTEVDAANFPGLYQVAPSATDANTQGPLALHASAAGADPCDEMFLVTA